MSTPPHPVCETPRVLPGAWLLEGTAAGPRLGAHRAIFGALPTPSLDELMSMVDSFGLRGRGGAAFPFATKLRATAASSGRPVVVVNLGEGEPASSKDSALARHRPHLILDGAVATARALGAREVHVVLPGERPLTTAAMEVALSERHDRRVRVVRHETSGRFVGGQSQAVIELMGGRPNLPVTAWTSAAVAGHRSRPTLLSNAETWAHVGRLLRGAPPAGLGTAEEPATTLLTVRTGPHVTVSEVEYGSDLGAVLPDHEGAGVLLGGYHGTWATTAAARSLRVSVPGFRAAGYSLGAGLVLCSEHCPVVETQRVVGFLAGESAGRCGPCLNGLPALARALMDLGRLPARQSLRRVQELVEVVDGRGACAHPDGTVGLVRSLLRTFPGEVELHTNGTCTYADVRSGRRMRSVAS